MTEAEYILLQQVKSAVNKNPSLFSDVVLFAQHGINQKIEETNEHAMNMEKLAFAFQCASSKKHTAATKEWIDAMIKSTKKSARWFNLGE